MRTVRNGSRTIDGMLDKTLPYYGVIMTKKDVSHYPKFELANGYSFRNYDNSMKDEWCRIQAKAGMIGGFSAARKAFEQKFLIYPDLLSKYCVFIVDSTDKAVAAASLWPGNHFGEEHWRIHWIAVDPDYQGIGLGKAMMTRLLDMFNNGNHGDWIYLTSQTWNYCAINIYYQFGFVPYLGEQPVNWYSDDFDGCNRKAWELIDKYISAYSCKTSSMMQLGEFYVKIESELPETADIVRKLIPMVNKRVAVADGCVRFIHDDNQNISFQDNVLAVALCRAELVEKKVLCDLIWLYYHILANNRGRFLVPKVMCEVVCSDSESNRAKLVFVRKRKYAYFDHYAPMYKLSDFWEISFCEGKIHIVDICFRTQYELCGIEWHNAKMQKQVSCKVSRQAFQCRMLSIAGLVLSGQFPLIGKYGYICNFPYLESRELLQDRAKLIRSLYEVTMPEEITGIGVW